MALYDFTPRRNNIKVWFPILAGLLVLPLFVKSEYILNIGL